MINLFESFAVIALLCILLFWRVEKVSDRRPVMNVQNTLALRGAFSIVIVLHHLSGYVNSITFLYPLKYCGYIVVAFFFFFSGYGLTWGLNNKSDYLRYFLIKRVLKIYLPYLLSILIYVIYGSIINKTEYGIFQILSSLICVDSISPLGWYIGALVILYIIFFLSAKSKMHYRKMFFAVLFIFVYVVLFLLPIAEEFPRSLIGFPIGICYCLYKKKIHLFIKEKIILCISFGIVGTAFGMVVKYLGESSDMSLVKLFGNIVSCSFAILLLIVCANRISFGNKVLLFLGGISFEIYLYHKLFLELFYQFDLLKVHCLLFFLITVISTVLFSCVVNLFDKMIYKALDKL